MFEQALDCLWGSVQFPVHGSEASHDGGVVLLEGQDCVLSIGELSVALYHLLVEGVDSCQDDN